MRWTVVLTARPRSLGDSASSPTSADAPYQQIPRNSLYHPPLLKTLVHFVVKARGNIAVAPEARALFHRIAPDLALNDFRTMLDAVDRSNFGARLGLYLIGAFAGLAVLMVMVGLYAVLAQVVSHRAREFRSAHGVGSDSAKHRKNGNA